MAYRLTKRARLDVLNIWLYIAQDSEPAADRFIDLLTHYFRLLGDNPYAGRSRNELRQGYRRFPVGQHVIFYEDAVALILEDQPGADFPHRRGRVVARRGLLA